MIDVSKLGGKRGVVLVVCGCFSPVTNLHLRLFEMARDELEGGGRGRSVIGGYLSPTHSHYPKPGLIAASHRVAMCRMACEGSDWIAVDDWEAQQPDWTRTRLVLDSITQRLTEQGISAQVMLLAGADLLQSFRVPGLWATEDLTAILERGLVIVDRLDIRVQQEILEQDLLHEYRHNIHWVPQPVENNVSSTLVRLLVKRGMSVRYLVPEAILPYLAEKGLYKDDKTQNL